MADILTAKYRERSILPDLWLTWRDSDRNLIPFGSIPYTFTMLVADRRTPSLLSFTKTTGFVGLDTDPNVVIQWGVTDLPTLTAGTYLGVIQGVRQSDGKGPREMPFTLLISRVPGMPFTPPVANDMEWESGEAIAWLSGENIDWQV